MKGKFDTLIESVLSNSSYPIYVYTLEAKENADNCSELEIDDSENEVLSQEQLGESILKQRVVDKKTGRSRVVLTTNRPGYRVIRYKAGPQEIKKKTISHSEHMHRSMAAKAARRKNVARKPKH